MRSGAVAVWSQLCPRNYAVTSHSRCPINGAEDVSEALGARQRGPSDYGFSGVFMSAFRTNVERGGSFQARSGKPIGLMLQNTQ